MAFLESKCEYRDGERIPIRPATSRRVTADSPSWRAISHAASRISRRVASRRSARLSRLGKALIVRQYAGLLPGLSRHDGAVWRAWKRTWGAAGLCQRMSHESVAALAAAA